MGHYTKAFPLLSLQILNHTINPTQIHKVMESLYKNFVNFTKLQFMKKQTKLNKHVIKWHLM
jgi:hypothetical protein